MAGRDRARTRWDSVSGLFGIKLSGRQIPSGGTFRFADCAREMRRRIVLPCVGNAGNLD